MMNTTGHIKIEDLSNEGFHNMEFHNDDYEDEYAAHSVSNDFPLNICGLCGMMGKAFIKMRENEDLISKINKYMPFIDMQHHFSDCICYSCSSQINSWNGFYLNCSSVNSKLNKETIIPEIGNFNSDKKQANMSNTIYTYPVDQINQSYSRLEENPCAENVARTMDVLTDCLKSLISQLKTSPSSSAVSYEETVLDGSNEDNESNSELNGLMKPIDVIEVGLPESEAALGSKNKSKLKRIQEVQSQHGTLFYDDDGYAYRVNKKQPGKVYVRCTDSKCPVRGTILGNSFRTNKHEHTHPPRRLVQIVGSRSLRNGKTPLSNKEKVEEEIEAYS